MEILVLCGIYVAELVCYQLGLRILFQVRQKTWVWMVVGILLPVGIGLIPELSVSGKNVWVTISVIGVVFLSIEGKVLEKGIWLVFMLLLLECVNAAFSALFNNLLMNYTDHYIENIDYLIIKFCTSIAIFLFNIFKDKLRYYGNTHINSAIYIMIGIMACSMIFCLRFLNQVIILLNNSKYIMFCDILNIAILVSIFLFVVFTIYIKNTHERMEQLLKTEQFLKEAQVNQYNQALKKEIDTRKYRHDMMNHLVYLQDTLNRNRINDAQKYLSSILGGFKKIQNTYYVIGNEMIDTIMNYYFGMLPNSVWIDIRGKCPVKLDLEDTDVCVIFSNLLQNVVEEITENNMKNAKIIIEVQKGQQYAEYRIINTLFTEMKVCDEDKNMLPKSHKQDKLNHGIGMVNVKTTVEKYHGKFEWYRNNGYFVVSVILPIRTE